MHDISTRLRLLDLNTPWFWLLVFWHGREYDQPWLLIECWPANRRAQWWFIWWVRERIPQREWYELSALEDAERSAGERRGY